MKYSNCRDAALDYIANNLSIVPTAPNEKRPAFNWDEYYQNPATRENVDLWWPEGEEESYGIAVITGIRSKNIVLDFDPNPGEPVENLIQEAEYHFGKPFPKTCRVQTASGGYHDHYRILGEVPTGIFYEGSCGKIEIRGEKSIAVMPPSSAFNRYGQLGYYTFASGLESRVTWEGSWMADEYKKRDTKTTSNENIPPEPTENEINNIVDNHWHLLSDNAKNLFEGNYPTDDRSGQLFGFGCELVRCGIESQYILAVILRASHYHQEKYGKRDPMAPYGRWGHAWTLAGKVLVEEENERDNAYDDELEDFHWKQPIPLNEHEPAVFPTNVLPMWLRDYVEAEAEATQTPTDLAGMLVLAIIATSIAKTIKVQVREGWVEPTNIYVVVVLPSGSRKSTVFTNITNPVFEYEKKLAKDMRPKIVEMNNRKDILEKEKRIAENKIVNKNGGINHEAKNRALELGVELSELKIPSSPQLMADDCSPEKLIGLLQEHGERMSILTPEGGIFETIAGRYSNGIPNLDVYLKGYSGDTLRVDRIGRSSEYVDHPVLTLGLAVQPDVLKGLIQKPYFRGRGLLGRFFYALPKSNIGNRKVNSSPVPASTKKAYEENVKNLLSLCTPLDEYKGPYTLYLSDEAHERFIKFEEWLEPQLSDFGELGNIQDWGGKLAGATARIAGILHMAENIKFACPWEEPINQEVIEKAILIAEYLINHAKAAFFEMGVEKKYEEARLFLNWVYQKELNEFTRTQLFDAFKGRNRFNKIEDLAAGLKVLEEHNYVKPYQPSPNNNKNGAGRPPSIIYKVNPHIYSIN